MNSKSAWGVMTAVALVQAADCLKVDAKPFKGFRAGAPVVRENADGSATVVCAVKRTGFCLIFR